jgi:hypothetical protein
MKIIKPLFLYALMFITLFVAGQTLSAQTDNTTPDLAGKWTISWVSSDGGVGSPNSITLTRNIAGIYTSDDKEQCPLMGGITVKHTIFTVGCSTFEISLDGFVQPNGTVIGDYKYHTPKGIFIGKFKMVAQ